MDFAYILLLMGVVFFSLHKSHRDRKFHKYIYGASTIFGIFMIIVMAVLLVDLVRGLASQ
jgi:uncharacterized membrane protein YkgB